MLRILYIQPTCIRGGIETVLLSALRHLNRSTVEPFVIFLENGALVKEVRSLGVAATVLPISHLRDVRNTISTIARITHFIRSHQINLVHCNGPKSQIYGSPAAKLAGVPNVYWLHHIPDTILGRDLMADLSFILPASIRLANSTATAEKMLRHPIIRKRAQVVWPGIDIASFYGGEAKAAWPSGDPPRMLSAGRIQTWKGQHIAIQATKLLMDRGRYVRLDIVGSPTFPSDVPYFDYLRNLAKELGVTDRVFFVPHAIDVTEWYRRADIALHTSVSAEPFGLVVVEAMAGGRPVIATNMGGTLDSMDYGRVGGMLIPPSDPSALADAIAYLLDHPGEALRLAAAGRERVRDHFGANQMTTALEHIYAGLARTQ